MPIHMADIGSDNYEQEFTLSLMQNEEGTLEAIEAAIERIEDGVYGICEECKGSSARLGWRRFLTPRFASSVLRNSNGADEPAMKAVPRSRILLFASIAVIGCSVDLLTKRWIFARLGMPAAKPTWWLIDDIFGFTTSLNEGALFGIGQGQVPLFVTLSLIAAVGIMYWLFVLAGRRRPAVDRGPGFGDGRNLWQPVRPRRAARPGLEFRTSAGPAGLCGARLAAFQG